MFSFKRKQGDGSRPLKKYMFCHPEEPKATKDLTNDNV